MEAIDICNKLRDSLLLIHGNQFGLMIGKQSYRLHTSAITRSGLLTKLTQNPGSRNQISLTVDSGCLLQWLQHVQPTDHQPIHSQCFETQPRLPPLQYNTPSRLCGPSNHSYSQIPSSPACHAPVSATAASNNPSLPSPLSCPTAVALEPAKHSDRSPEDAVQSGKRLRPSEDSIELSDDSKTLPAVTCNDEIFLEVARRCSVLQA